MLVNQLARILALEDARNWERTTLAAALVDRSPVVRRTAALAAGRIGSTEATPLLTQAMADPDSGVAASALFALGLLRDSAAVPPVVALLGRPVPLPVAVEGMAAVAKTGGQASARFLAAELGPAGGVGPLRLTAAIEAWRLGPDSPVDALLVAAVDSSAELRWRAVYSLARRRVARAAPTLLELTTDPDSRVRMFAVRPLTRVVADSVGAAHAMFIGALRLALGDPEPGVRINALAALATFGHEAPKEPVIAQLDHPDPNVRVGAASALGAIGDPQSTPALTGLLSGGERFAVEREAVIALARSDPLGGFMLVQGAWSANPDWRRRAVAAQAWALPGLDGQEGRPNFLVDPDPRVVWTALQAFLDAGSIPDSSMLSVARAKLSDPDAMVRAAAAGILGRAPSPLDAAPLDAMLERSLSDSIPDASLAALGALRAIEQSSADGQRAVASTLLARAPASARADYLLRMWAQEHWPELAAIWGPARPIATGRTPDFYRRLVETYLLGPAESRRPVVAIETEDRGVMVLELFGDAAPITVDNFLSLTDRHFFDGNRWQRVVPNFVVQDGDPRGDGNGGPGGAIRDELNRHRYGTGALGMALSGPDTGSSQWFITLSPQPHLDGTYTVFGQLIDGEATLQQITQGDRLATVHRVQGRN